MTRSFLVRLDDLQPSQLYINEEKLAEVVRRNACTPSEDRPPVPVKKLRSKLVLLDGHTRALAAWRAGHTEIRAVWETHEWDWDAYEICLDWCEGEGIHTIADLNDRVVAVDDYHELWIERCRAMHEDIRRKRDKATR